MANKMLIDASHPEETRVAVVKGNRVEEFDFEAANRVQLRGNIYLAKVTRSRAVPTGGLRRLWRKSSWFPGFQRDSSRLLSNSDR